MISDTYFGHPDAAKEEMEVIKRNHFNRKVEGDIKAYTKSEGKQIIVGIKGSGKTDLRRSIESKEKAIFFNLNDENIYLRGCLKITYPFFALAG